MLSEVPIKADYIFNKTFVRRANTTIIQYKINIKMVPPHTVAIDVEPSDAMTSELTRTVYGKSASGGNTESKAFSASVPTKGKSILRGN